VRGKDKLAIVVHCELDVNEELAMKWWDEIEELQRDNRQIFDKTIVDGQLRFRILWGNMNAVCMNDVRTMLSRFTGWTHDDDRIKLKTSASLKELGETTPHYGTSTRGRKRNVPIPIRRPAAAAL